MALTGYVFREPAAIVPVLEPAGSGPTAQLCSALARRLECHVVAGYPEALPEALPEGSGAEEADGAEVGAGVGFNSAVVVDPTGMVVGNYRKTFLFETDKVWARAGSGFAHFDLEGIGRVALGICMGVWLALRRG